MKLLLDTHVFIWLVSNLERVPLPIQAALESEENIVYPSVVNSWEMQIKMQLGKLDLPVPRKQLFDQSVKNDFRLLTIKASHIDALDQLTLEHRDPFDRMLMAQAKAENMRLVSADSKVHKYQDQVNLFWPDISR